MRAGRQNGDLATRKGAVMQEAVENGNGKPRKRAVVKMASELPAKKVKSTIHLSREADQRLDIHCTMMGFDRSSLVEKLINDTLRRYVVSDRGGSPGTLPGEEAA